MKAASQPEPVADVTLFLEGTYPYVLGGVSSWVQQIITGMPELKFSLLYIGAKQDPKAKQHYKLPDNVISLKEVYLHTELSRREQRRRRIPAELRIALYDLLAKFYLARTDTERMACFWAALDGLQEVEKRFRFGNLLRDREAWEILVEGYEEFCPDESFIDFFWTARFLHLPLWNLWKARDLVPPARVYHSVSAGYAGFLGAVTARRRHAPFFLTEHGIYTKERIAEISQADWIYEPDRFQINYSEGLGKLKQMWINLFMFLGKVAYDQATNIITLYSGNAATEIEFGADERKISIIPNGIEPTRFDAIYQQHMARWQASPEKKYVGFIGRVVPIKDVKTLLRAARIVCERMPEVEFLIAGPYAEDPTYFDECSKIVKLLHIEEKVHFLGMSKIMDVLPRMDVLVLTSISEGLPLVVLEGMAAGKPNVCSDVGACRELMFGRTPPDKALGRAGRLTKIMSPAETAHALIGILSNPETCVKMGVAGRKRAEQFYSMTAMLGAYRDLYHQLAGKPLPAPASSPAPVAPAAVAPPVAPVARRPKGLP
jgi:polysaccharide biosynthesis protein PelF